MNKLNQDGAASGLAVSLILTVVLLLGAIGFGYWAYASRQDYKDNTDAKIDVAVKKAVAAESARKDKQFTEDYKKPLKTYNGPSALGSIVVQYPKTWSGYVDATTSGDAALDAYFNPNVVPSVEDENSTFALRVRLLNQPYPDVVDDYKGQNSIGKTATISAYALPKLPKVVGVKVVGAISERSDGTIIVLPLRSQTLEIQTDGNQYLNDFNKYILPNFTFSP
ncbi:MAG TPA: hypothetical protein VFX84_01250 [Candidatus Saccharimonadales bacterium]|nr:hypothetical protein [Candidatus Saccharimonadales bacterium]